MGKPVYLLLYGFLGAHMIDRLGHKDIAMNTFDTLDLDGVADLLKVDHMEVYDNFYIENNYCECSEELQGKGECNCGFDNRRNELYSKYVAAVEKIAEALLNEHGLMLVKDEEKHTYKIMPRLNWKDAANKIRETINGVGYFYFDNVGEFLRSGPYTARQATLTHLHWIKRWYDVYGDGSAQGRLDRALRY